MSGAIIAGFGFRRGATAESLADALAATGWGNEVAALATLRGKAAGLAGLAAARRLPIIAVDPDLARRQATATGSAASAAAHGTGSVAEASALAAAMPTAAHLGPSAMAEMQGDTPAVPEDSPAAEEVATTARDGSLAPLGNTAAAQEASPAPVKGSVPVQSGAPVPQSACLLVSRVVSRDRRSTCAIAVAVPAPDPTSDHGPSRESGPLGAPI